MDIIFKEHPDVWLGSSLFRKIPTIIQYKDIPMLEVGQFVDAGYTTKFPVYHNDGTHIATVKGSQVYLTEAGKRARVTQRYEPGLTVCELDGQTILELRRDGPAALKGWAELYAPEGVLIKSSGPMLSELVGGDGHLTIGGQIFMDVHFEGHPIGIHCLGNGSYHLGIKHLRYTGPADKPLPFESVNSPSN